jgi:hypothetical protein
MRAEYEMISDSFATVMRMCELWIMFLCKAALVQMVTPVVL